jgi:hypothetical protein
VLLDVMPGHGRDNLLHELEQGGAEACGPTAADIAASVRAVLDAPGLDGPGYANADERPRAAAVPRWEPAFAAALGEIGLEVPPSASPGDAIQVTPST